MRVSLRFALAMIIATVIYACEENLVHVTKVTVSPSAVTLEKGMSSRLTATVTPSNATEKGIFWSSDNSSVASVSEDGTVTAISPGAAVIIAKSRDNGISASCSVTVPVGFIHVAGISLDKEELSLIEEDTICLTATIVPVNATDKTVFWASSDTSIVKVSQDGEVSATSDGKAVVSVTTNDGGKTAVCEVTVFVPVKVTGISLNKTKTKLNTGESETLVATVIPENATNKKVIWSSDNPDIVSVDEKGTLTAKSVGTTYILAKTEDGNKYAACTVIVNPISVTGVSVKPSTTILVGDSEKLEAVITPENASNKNVFWTSDNPTVAYVNKDGNVSGVKPGSATITVTTEDGGRKAYCAVTVEPVRVTGVTLEESTTIDDGTSKKLTPKIIPENATNKEVTWSSDNSETVSVDAGGAIIAKKVGTATVTVKTVDGGKTASCKVTVKPVSVTGVSVKESTSIFSGSTETLTATISPSNATNKKVTWSSDNTSVATVDQNGKVTGKSVGSARITVTTEDGHKSASCAVTVQRVAVTGISLKPSTSIALGNTEILVATVLPENATDKSVKWQSDNPGIASVDGSGKITAKAIGMATITATTVDGGKTASCVVTVAEKTSYESNPITIPDIFDPWLN